MKKSPMLVLATVALAAAGFAGAAIVNGGSLAATLETGTTGTTTIPTTTTPAGRKVTICHRTGSKKNPGRTITVSQNAVAAHVAHGDHVGPCTGAEQPKQKGKDAAKKASTPDTKAKDDAKAKDGAQAKDDDDAQDDQGKSGDHGKSGDKGKSGKKGK
jgi:hypothetical protein